MKTHLVVNQRVSLVFTHIYNQFTIIYCHDLAKTPAAIITRQRIYSGVWGHPLVTE